MQKCNQYLTGYYLLIQTFSLLSKLMLIQIHTFLAASTYLITFSGVVTPEHRHIETSTFHLFALSIPDKTFILIFKTSYVQTVYITYKYHFRKRKRTYKTLFIKRGLWIWLKRESWLQTHPGSENNYVFLTLGMFLWCKPSFTLPCHLANKNYDLYVIYFSAHIGCECMMPYSYLCP